MLPPVRACSQSGQMTRLRCSSAVFVQRSRPLVQDKRQLRIHSISSIAGCRRATAGASRKASTTPSAAAVAAKEVAQLTATATDDFTPALIVPAAAVSPPIVLTPMQSLVDRFLSSGSLGEWRDESLAQGYMNKQQQQQHSGQRPPLQQHSSRHDSSSHRSRRGGGRRSRGRRLRDSDPEYDVSFDALVAGQSDWNSDGVHKANQSRGQATPQQVKHMQQHYQEQQQRRQWGSSAQQQQYQPQRRQGLHYKNHNHQQHQRQVQHLLVEQQQHWWQLSVVTAKSRALTQNLSAQTTARGILHFLQAACADIQHQQQYSANIVHLATACRALVNTQQQQKRQQQQQQQGDQGSRPETATEELLQLVETLLTEQLTDVAAAAGSSEYGSSSPNLASAAAVPSAAEVAACARSLSTLVYSWGRLQHKASSEVLELLLEAFLVLFEQQQEHPQQQEQQQQHDDVSKVDNHHSNSGNANSSTIEDSSSKLDQSNSRALSNLCWGLSKLGYTCDTPYGGSSSYTTQQQQQLHHRQQQLLRQQRHWSRLAALAVQQTAAAAAAAASPRDVSSLCYGFAAGGYKDVVLWGRLAPRVIMCVDEFTPHDLSEVLWAYATAGVPHQGVFAAAAPAAQQLTPGFTPQGLVNVLWAYQTLLHDVPEGLLAAATAECLDRSSSGTGLVAFGPLNLSMLAWVYAKNKSISPALSSAISRAVIPLLDTIQPPDLCRLLGAFAVLRCADHNMLDAAELRMLSMLEAGHGHVQVVCQGVWAYAASNHPGGVRLLLQLLLMAEKHLGVLVRSGDATARLLSTLVMLRYRADGFISILAQRLTAAAAAGRDVAATGKSLEAVVTAGREQTAAAAAAAAVNHLTRWDTKILINAAAALAKLGHTSESELLSMIIKEFISRSGLAAAGAAHASSTSRKKGRTRKASQDLSTTDQHTAASANPRVTGSLPAQCILLLWCAAVCDLRKDTKLLLLLAAAVQQAVGSSLSHKSLAQLVQVYMWVQTLGPAGKPLLAALPKPLMDQALFFWQHELVPTTTHSSLHGEVMSELSALRLRPTKEGVTPDGMFSVDCMVKFQGCEVALEVMGAEHYSCNKVLPLDHQQQQQGPTGGGSNSRGLPPAAAAEPQHVLLGPEVLRMRLLAARGYALATVSAFEWERVKSKGGARELLLLKLQEAVQRHKAAAAASAAANDNGKQHRRQGQLQQHQQATQEIPTVGKSPASDAIISSSATSSHRQQQPPDRAIPDIEQQVSHLMLQQGRAPAVWKGKLRREQYWQQRKALDKQGMMLVTMAAPWAAAEGKQTSSSDYDGSSGVLESSAELSYDDGEFDLALDLDDLLADMPDL